MRKSFIILIANLASFVLFGCSPFPQDRVIAKIGNTSLFTSDAEFLAATKPETTRDKKSIMPDLQQTAETRRMAEVARLLFAGEQSSIQKKLTEGENGRLAQIYVYFYVQANMGYTNKALLDYYKKNESRYTDSSVIMPLANFREKIAADLFLAENPELAARVNDTNKAAIIDSCRRAKMDSELDRLKKLYDVELVKIEPSGLEEYYKEHPEQFQTRAKYKLLNLSDKDSSALASKIKKISTREEFAKIAEEMPFIKQGHAIMDIGMFPALDEEISKLGAKKFTRILHAPDVDKYYVFYIDSIVEPQLKPWDRAKDFAKSVMESKGDYPLDSSVVLVTIGKKPLITEKEVLEFRAKLGPRQQTLRRNMVLNNLIEEALYARAAKEKGLDKSNEYIAWTRQIADRLYVRVLMDSVLTATLGIPEEALKTAYESEKDSLFLPKSFEDSKLDVAVWLRIPDISYRREFVLNRQKYGDATNWESIRRAAYKNIRYNEFAGIQEREQANLRKSVPVAIIDTSWGLEFTPDNLEELSEQAKIQYNNQNPQKAKELWEKVRTLFPQNDSIQRLASYELASIYQDIGQYSAAVNEYRVIIGLWGDEPDAYKAYFMQGFVLSEYEKKDSLALLAFEEMLKKFPNSELSEDARVMVNNIKSGGKILEELIKKIESSSEE
jgi:DNA uptake lipoprotein